MSFVGSKFIKPYQNENYKVTITPCKNSGGKGNFDVTLQEKNSVGTIFSRTKPVSVNDDTHKIVTLNFDVNIFLNLVDRE